MQVNITGQHVEVTESMHNYTMEKLERLERHFENITNVHVILSVEKLRQKAEATVHVNGGDLFADSEETDMYAALDGLIDKLDRQIRKHKEKMKDHHRSEGDRRNVEYDA